MLNGHGRHFRQQNTTQRIGDRGIDANKIKADLLLSQTIDLDLDVLLLLVGEVVAGFAIHIRLS